MKKTYLLLLAIIISISNGITQETNSQININKMILKYSDGNGNSYKIIKGNISFQPISREMSSSGLYDGGEPAQNKITKKNFKKVYLAFESIFKNKKIQIPNRIKTSGLLSMQEEGEDKKVSIIKKSEEQKQLELMLKELLKL
ncbi:MAG: hypothetical protein DRJ07_07415 [Bacteroidetes bacterium]|nr:MAG: hypothetical protein DRJ07_07415 [Bacteroidota bacterium]